MKAALDLEEGVLASVKALSTEEKKKKMDEDARFISLEGKTFEEIPGKVVMESLKAIVC